MKWRAAWLSLVFTCLFLYGCDVSHWPGLSGARPVPSARMLIELPEPRTLTQLYPDYIEVASRGGFIHSRGYDGHRPVEDFLSETYGGSAGDLRWAEQPDVQSALQRQVVFLTKFNAAEEPEPAKRVATTLTFMFQRENVGSFTKDEWLEFFRFYEEILPDVFPDADIRISETGHPAIYTDEAVLRQIQNETAIDIPEKYLPVMELE